MTMYYRTRDNNLIAPYIVAPSGDFHGNDGKWSTFTINIGDADATGKGQNLKVLISTSSPLTLVPKEADWCDNDCAQQRGVEIFNAKQPLGFISSASKTWNEQGLYSIPVPDWWTGAGLDGIYGTDNVGLGQSDPRSIILEKQWVVEHRSEELFMGYFGLAAGKVSIGGGAAMSPFITQFAAAKQAPSTSYGYTAGAAYRYNNKGIPANLVIGGFDNSRLKQEGTVILMPSSTNNTLVVGVQSILYHDSTDYSLTEPSPGFLATIDSTLPFLYLPDDICDRFADKFRLQFDNRTGLYTVNDTAHEYNLEQNADVTFKISGDIDISLDASTITLPYAAFDLQASFPIYAKATNYFPIKKSNNGNFVLGRTFLQEAYIIVDYERANFTIAPAAFSNPMPEPEIVTIFGKGYVPPSATSTSAPASSGMNALTPASVTGIVAGIVIILLLLGVGAFFFWKKQRAPRKEQIAKAEIPELGPNSEDLCDNKHVIQFLSISELESPLQSFNPHFPSMLATPIHELPGEDDLFKI